MVCYFTSSYSIHIFFLSRSVFLHRLLKNRWLYKICVDPFLSDDPQGNILEDWRFLSKVYPDLICAFFSDYPVLSFRFIFSWYQLWAIQHFCNYQRISTMILHKCGGLFYDPCLCVDPHQFFFLEGTSCTRSFADQLPFFCPHYPGKLPGF